MSQLLKYVFLFAFLLNHAHSVETQSTKKEKPFQVEAKKKKKKKKKDKYKKIEPIQVTPKVNESKLAHTLLDGKRGIEIGASVHNSFGLKTLNVDYTDDENTAFKQEEKKKFGHCVKVDVVAQGDDLPFKDNTWDFVISSHVLEHFYDPIKTVKEWLRVVKPGGYVYMIIPHKERTFDKDRPRTTLEEIIRNHQFPNPPVPDHHGHYSVWITQDFLDICTYYQWPVVAVQDTDDKVGNGFTIVIQKPYPSVASEVIDEEPVEESEPEVIPEAPLPEPEPEVVILPVIEPELAPLPEPEVVILPIAEEDEPVFVIFPIEEPIGEAPRLEESVEERVEDEQELEKND